MQQQFMRPVEGNKPRSDDVVKASNTNVVDDESRVEHAMLS